MKKLAFLLLIVVTWYLAGMYHLFSFMVLAVTEIIFGLWMFLLPFYLRRFVDTGFETEKTVVEKNGKTPCILQANNRGIFPASCFRLQLNWNYEGTKDGGNFTLYGSVSRKDREKLEFTPEFPWCGIVKVSLKKIEFFDYFTLFRKKKKLNSKGDILVMPKERRLRIQIRDRDSSEFIGVDDETSMAVGNNPDEIYQTREYLPGDSVRFIHWKQSARTDTLWVKEFQQEKETILGIYLDFSGEQRRTLQEMDAFYEILSALLFSFLDYGKNVQVRWEDKENRTRDWKISDQAKVCDLLKVLYMENEDLYRDSRKRTGSGPAQTGADYEISLDLDLNLRCGKKLIFRYTKEEYVHQMTKNVLVF